MHDCVHALECRTDRCGVGDVAPDETDPRVELRSGLRALGESRSKPTTSWPSSRSAPTVYEPTLPNAPVTNTFISLSLSSRIKTSPRQERRDQLPKRAVDRIPRQERLEDRRVDRRARLQTFDHQARCRH